ncbi:MAG: hypothetical protein H0W45_12080, partial [Acidobacteria bacterium]|nr:hypothetical protein [Acidobacteriota bacterium]
MPENNISDAAEYIADKPSEEIGLTAEGNANLVILDPSTPSVRSIVRVVIITLLILFVAGFISGILTSLTYLFFLIVLSIFFAYLIEPLVQV